MQGDHLQLYGWMGSILGVASQSVMHDGGGRVASSQTPHASPHCSNEEPQWHGLRTPIPRASCLE